MLKEQIQKNVNISMKEGNSLAATTLRMLLAAIVSKEKEKRYKIFQKDSKTDLEKESQLTDEEIIETVSSEIKKRRDAIVLYEKGKRQELADKEKEEISVLQKYLPEQMPEEKIREIVLEAILKTGAKEAKDMGKVMAEVIPKTKGKAESGTISRIVKESLGKTAI